MNKISWYLKLARLDRPVGIFLLLWPTLWALLLASDGNLKIFDLKFFESFSKYNLNILTFSSSMN